MGCGFFLDLFKAFDSLDYNIQKNWENTEWEVLLLGWNHIRKLSSCLIMEIKTILTIYMSLAKYHAHSIRFFAFLNNVPLNITFQNCRLINYADDTTNSQTLVYLEELYISV